MVVRNKKKKKKEASETVADTVVEEPEAKYLDTHEKVQEVNEEAKQQPEPQVEAEEEEDGCDDDWETADIDKMAKKIVQKGA